MESLLKAKNLEITYDPASKYIYCNWIGFQNKQSIMDSGGTILDVLKKKGASKVLNDNTLVTGPWRDAAEWTATVWFPDMINAGLRHFAWVFSRDIFAELSAKKAMPANDIVKSFNDLEEARQWLIKVSVTR